MHIFYKPNGKIYQEYPFQKRNFDLFVYKNNGVTVTSYILAIVTVTVPSYFFPEGTKKVTSSFFFCNV